MKNMTRSLEDYLEAIWLLSRERKVVRVKDVANRLGVTTSSVVEALHNLQQRGLIIHERYGYIDLTPEGESSGRLIYNKHSLLYEFFTRVLGVSPEVADRDACNIEHYISMETLEKLSEFMKSL
ncbi:metal-dependent transcriptional regulator [candidate division WOR-3 bacterium]|nr:metal-dependent transcriptional regulator [candidate division WOR-3 bacterium]